MLSRSVGRGVCVGLVAGVLSLVLGALPALADDDGVTDWGTPFTSSFAAEEAAKARNTPVPVGESAMDKAQRLMMWTMPVVDAARAVGCISRIGSVWWALDTYKSIAHGQFSLCGDTVLPAGGEGVPAVVYTNNGLNCGWWTGDPRYQVNRGDGFVDQACDATHGPAVRQWPTAISGEISVQIAPNGICPMTGINNGAALGITRSATEFKSYILCAGGNSTWASTKHVIGTVTVPMLTGGMPPDPSTPATTGAAVHHTTDTYLCENVLGETIFAERTSEGWMTTGLEPGGYGGFVVPVAPAYNCPDEFFLTEGTSDITTEGSEERVPLREPYVIPPTVKADIIAYPDCAPVGVVICSLKLWKVIPAPDYDCNAHGQGTGNRCLGWYSNPDKAMTYQCRYGAYVLPLWRCDSYKTIFNPDGRYTGTPPIEGPAPLPEGEGDPTPEQTPGLGDCVPTWQKILNPFAMFKSIACGLSWGFIPGPGSLSLPFSDFSGLWSSRPPGSLVNGAKDVFGAIPAGWNGTGCVGSSSADFSPVTAPGALRLPCSPAGGGPGSLPYTVMQIALIVGTLFALWHMVAGAVGATDNGGD